MMVSVFHMIKNTPFFVWGILIFLLFFGIRSIKTRQVHMVWMFLVPCLFLSFQHEMLFSERVVKFFFFFLFGTSLSIFVHQKQNIKVVKSFGSIEVPGSWLTLMILLFLFLVKYCFGYLQFMHSELFVSYLYVENFISGVGAGYFFGRSLYFMYKYLQETI
ncbi:hypothetical protein [Holospora obtusa]|nr:hypothetical protein [Holospora obtusa]